MTTTEVTSQEEAKRVALLKSQADELLARTRDGSQVWQRKVDRIQFTILDGKEIYLTKIARSPSYGYGLASIEEGNEAFCESGAHTPVRELGRLVFEE